MPPEAIHCFGVGCTDTLYPNGAVTPAGTFYSVCITVKGLVLRCNNYLINGAFDLNSAVPLNVTPGVGPAQLITQGFQCVNLTPATTWTCTHNFNDLNVVVNVYDSNSKQISRTR